MMRRQTVISETGNMKRSSEEVKEQTSVFVLLRLKQWYAFSIEKNDVTYAVHTI